MHRILLLGLSALYAGLSVNAAIAATVQTSELAPRSMLAAGQTLPQPPNFDASLAGDQAKTGVQQQQKIGGQPGAATGLVAPEVISSDLRYTRLQPAGILGTRSDDVLGRPAFIWAGAEAGSGLDFYAYQQGEGALSYAQAYLKQFASRLQITPNAVDTAELVFLHDDGAGPVIARYQQMVNGLQVMNRQLNVVMNQDLELIAISGYFASAKGAQRKDFSAAFRAGPQAAMNAAFNDLGLSVSAYNLYDTAESKAGFSQFAPTSQAKSSGDVNLTAPVGAKKVLFPLGGELLPGWLMTVQAGSADSQASVAYSYVTSADGAQLLYRKNLMAHDSYTYRVFADATTLQPDDSPFGNALMPHPTGNPADPLSPVFGAGTLVTVADGSQGITDAWLPIPVPGAPVHRTQGNNVWAYADIAGADGRDDPLDVYATTTAAGVFDYTINSALQPSDLTNQQAGIVNLFYLNNWLHDTWYNAGFTEAAGNAQYTNYGRGGAEFDPIFAESQDFSGRNNANMSTPPDGFVPRMQMYIFDGPISTLEVLANSPAGVTTFDPVGYSTFGPLSYTASGDVSLYNDGDASGTGVNGELDGCQPTTQDLTGTIAIIGDIYTCNFTVKIKNAQNAGAVGALVVFNGLPPGADAIFNMGGSDPTITIPSLSISEDDVLPVYAELTAGGTVNLTMHRVTDTNRDGSLDSQVVAHEFFHYVSNRLVGDASGLSNTQGRGMGEGWGDVDGLLLSVRENDLANQPDGLYTIGGFDVDDFAYGIRRMPYTTNMAINPLTFQHIENGVPLPPAAIPYAFGANGASNAEVHNIGEIWVLPLWEAYVALYQHYATVNSATAFAIANAKLKNYIIEGLMATPNAPTMIEARDAILAAVKATDATDYDIFVAAFAKRGMGFGAIAPPRTSTDMAGVVESFETDLKVFTLEEAALDTDFVAGACDADGTLDPGEVGQLTLRIANIGSADLTGVTAQLSSTADISFANGGLVEFDTLPMFGGTATATATVTVNSATSTSEVMAIDVSFPDVGGSADEVIEPAAIQLQFISNQDYQATLFTDTVENAAASRFDWTRQSVGAEVEGWLVDNTFSAALGLPADNDYWYGVDSGAPGETALITPVISVGPDPFSVSFYHYYQFESGGFDGGVMEISINGGAWQDVVAAGGTFAFGYNGAMPVFGFGNPLEGRAGFVDFGGTIIDGAPESISFGTALAGSSVQLRFRVGTDAAVGEVGWIVDDVTVTGATAPVFSSAVAENGVCLQPPEADAGPRQRVAAGTLVTLQGSATDAQAAELNIAWVQTGGTAVTLSDPGSLTPSFTAPFVNDTLTFELTVTDALGNSDSDRTKVRVRDGRPDADAGPNQLVNSETFVTLDGSGSSDAEGSLTYEWTQTGGVGVTLSDVTAVSPTFTAPDDVTSSLRFKLTVTDQAGQTARDHTVVVLINADDDDWWWRFLQWLWGMGN